MLFYFDDLLLISYDRYVEAIERQVDYYETESGKKPFQEWLLSMKDKEGRRKILARVGRLRAGNFGHCKAVGAGVMELKIDFGPGYRVYLGQSNDTIIILLKGGDKKSQPTDIKTAQAYWADYRRRYE